MNCNETQKFIDPYGDGELDSLRHRQVEGHLQSCAICAQAYKNHQDLRAVLKTDALYFKSSPRLRRQIQTAVREVAEADSKCAKPARQGVLWRWSGLAVSMAVLVLMMWRFAPRPSSPTGDDDMVREILSSHVRSLMEHHLTDVTSSDVHVVKPWFAGKLKYAPEVKNLSQQGFVLVGGRLDYVAKEPVAALVYKRRSSFINLFVCPSDLGGKEEDEEDEENEAKEGSVESKTRQGYHLLYWAAEDRTFWVVSDLGENELKRFVKLVQDGKVQT